MQKYIQIPYKLNGRDFNGCDCYGLLVLYFKVELGIDLLDYKLALANANSLTDTRYMLENAHNDFIKIEDPRKNDVVMVCNGSRTPNHCGIVLDNGLFIHTLEGVGCAISKLKTWNKRIYSFHRHKDLP